MTNPVQAALAKELADLAAAGADMAPLQAAIAALPPPAPALAVSPSGAYIDNIGPILVDKFGNTWQIVAGNRGNDNPPQMLALNGTTVPSGAVILGLIFDGIFYQENSDAQQTPVNKWWNAPAADGAFVAVPGDPRAAAPAPPIASPPIISSGPTPPPQAVAAGYGKVAFFDDFTSASTIAPGDTIGAGQMWCRPSNSPVGALNGGTLTVANSIVSMSNGAWLQNINLDGTVGGDGFLLSGGGYMEAEIAFDPTEKGDSAFWTMSAEHLQQWSGKGTDQWPGAPAGFSHFAEMDIAEIAGGSLAAGFDGSIQDWFGAFINGQFSKASNNPGFSSDQNGNHIPTNFSDYVLGWPAGVDPTKFNKFGLLWLPSIGGAPGLAQIFLNGQPTPMKVTWQGQPPSYNGTNPGTAPWTFGIIDLHHFPVYLGAANEPSVMQIDSVMICTK
jgi:hypothetical protein